VENSWQHHGQGCLGDRSPEGRPGTAVTHGSTLFPDMA
jgi:hypothetical protein